MTSGADVVASGLARHGVDCVFGVPGSQNVALFDALKRHGIATVLATSETAAGFMALGWHRATGRLGVYAAVCGPGFAYAIPPLAEAAHDASAILLIAGRGPGRGRMLDLQEIDQDTIAATLCGVVATANETATVPAAIGDALRATCIAGPQPAVFQHTKRALEGRVDNGTLSVTGDLPQACQLPDDLVDAISRSERPLLIVGAETLSSIETIDPIMNALGAVVTTTPAARGIIREDHDKVIAADLLCDSAVEFNRLAERADLILAVGCRFSHNGSGGFGMAVPEHKLAHVHPDPAVLQANYPAQWSITAPAAAFTTKLRHLLDGRSRKAGWSDEEVAQLRQRIVVRVADQELEPNWPDVGINGCRRLLSLIRSALPDDTILVTDTGNHQIYVRKYFDVLTPRGLICPTDFQSMGFGLPAAIGAALAATARPVAAIIGDGGLLMTSAELATLARLQAPLTVVVFSDGYLGQIRAQQLESGLDEEMTTLQMPDIELLARAHGLRYERADMNLGAMLADCIASQKPALVEIRAEDSPASNRRRTWRQMRRKVVNAIRA